MFAFTLVLEHTDEHHHNSSLPVAAVIHLTAGTFPVKKRHES